MSCRIAGMGWVTPLGTDVAAVCAAIAKGTTAAEKTIENPEAYLASLKRFLGTA